MLISRVGKSISISRVLLRRRRHWGTLKKIQEVGKEHRIKRGLLLITEILLFIRVLRISTSQIGFCSFGYTNTDLRRVDLMCSKNSLDGLGVLEVVKISYIFDRLARVWSPWMGRVYWSFSLVFVVTVSFFLAKILSILFGTSLASTHSTPMGWEFDSSLRSGDNTDTGFIVVLVRSLAFSTAELVRCSLVLLLFSLVVVG